MKRIPKFIIILMLGFALPIISASGQDKKQENKVKVVIVDDSGTKTVIDTTFTGDKMPETITLEDGKVIHITKNGIDLTDSEKDNGYVYHYSSSDNRPNKHMIIASAGENPDDQTISKTIIITDKNNIKNNSGKTYNVVVSDNEGESGSDAPKYIIAKDGVVVTIQTDDEAKAKDLQQLIENKLGVKRSDKK